MGWEIHFNSYEKNKDGKGYDMESPTSFKKVIGKMDDIPLERVASEIVKQMARRDVLVEVDKIYEYTKKEISFREAKGAVVIKGQKFNLDGLPVEAVQEQSEVRVQQVAPQKQLYVPSTSVLTDAIGEALGQTQPEPMNPMRSLRERIGIANPEASIVFENTQTQQAQ